MAVQLTDEQKQTVGSWVQAGLGLSDIQKRLKTEFEISMSFIDVRFLVLDLNLKVQDKIVAEPTNLTAKKGAQAQPQQGGPFRGAPAEPAGMDPSGEPDLGGEVSVEIDRIKKPGAMVSGTVIFSDGVKASWMLDQHGRVAIEASQAGYRPPESDLMAFQQEIAKKLQSQGY